MKNLVSIVVFALSLSFSSAWVLPSKYRSDYEYNRWTESFYKLHTEAKTSWEATKICKAEGAEVISVDGLGDMKQIQDLFKKHLNLGDHMWVRSDEKRRPDYPPYERQLENDNTLSEPCKCFRQYKAVGRHGEVDNLTCSKELPFICKVRLYNAPYDTDCDVFSHEYINNSTMTSCYRISSNIVTWHEAEAECRAQNAHLVIVNSETERAVLEDLMRDLKPVEGGIEELIITLAGFKTDTGSKHGRDDFKTIFGETLQEAGFTGWGEKEPNNYGGAENCGSITKDGKLNDVACTLKRTYICEKEKNCDA